MNPFAKLWEILGLAALASNINDLSSTVGQINTELRQRVGFTPVIDIPPLITDRNAAPVPDREPEEAEPAGINTAADNGHTKPRRGRSK